MNLAGKRIMLIGGAGLVGSHIVDQLTAEPVSGDRRLRQLRARHARQPDEAREVAEGAHRRWRR